MEGMLGSYYTYPALKICSSSICLASRPSISIYSTSRSCTSTSTSHSTISNLLSHSSTTLRALSTTLFSWQSSSGIISCRFTYPREQAGVLEWLFDMYKKVSFCAGGRGVLIDVGRVRQTQDI